MVLDTQTTDVFEKLNMYNTSSRVKKFLLFSSLHFVTKKKNIIATKTQSHNNGIVWEQEEEGRRGLFNTIPDDDDDGNDTRRIRIRIGNKQW